MTAENPKFFLETLIARAVRLKLTEQVTTSLWSRSMCTEAGAVPPPLPDVATSRRSSDTFAGTMAPGRPMPGGRSAILPLTATSEHANGRETPWLRGSCARVTRAGPLTKRRYVS